MHLASGCIACSPSGDSTQGIVGHRNPSTSPESSGRELNEIRTVSNKWEPVSWRELWRECRLQLSKGESGRRRVVLELWIPTLCPVEGHQKRVQECNRIEEIWHWSLPVSANSGQPICRDELEGAADPKRYDLREREFTPYHQNHRTEWSKHLHAFIL